ncbi:hypothetical protein SDC9_183487 [bioreactor metagenome]|uniref:Uncharacterized protein n=1 Tax=bioreactor metagenome TaxID=1076179 RepID=A0A645HC84_9ZZZZ
MQRCHFSDGVAEEFIRRTQRDITAADMRQRDAQHCRRRGRGKNFVPVAQHQHAVGRVGAKISGKQRHRFADSLAGAQRGGRVI